MENFEIRDLRRKNFFQIDDEYLNGYAKLCGLVATGVYVSLCRHVNKQQTCFPSKKLIAEELAISERSVYTAIKKLEEWNIVKVEDQGRKKGGEFNNKIYILIDKNKWKKKPQATGADGNKQHSPQATGAVHRRQDVPNKETHIEVNTYKDSELGSQVNSLIKLFSNVNPSYEKFYANKTQRATLERLIKKYTEVKVAGFIRYLPIINEDKYAHGKSITPLQLEDNLAHIINHFKSNNKKITSV